MNDEYTNLNYVTLYKTPMFNRTDSIMFRNELERDTFFASIPSEDQLRINEFTDLFENRSFSLPYNYLDLKKYNTMLLHYDDGLGHIRDYYCNVDNYIYVSTDVCVPIYRIDYFLTYGHLLYDKELDIITNRRTVKESDITRDMKADEVSIPRLKYERYNSWSEYYPNEETNYIIFLNKTKDGNGKKGITCTMGVYLGTDSNGDSVFKKFDDYTIGCYLIVCNSANLTYILEKEPLEYVEKIIESNVPPLIYLSSTDLTSYNSNGYVYVSENCYPLTNGEYYRQVPIQDKNFVFTQNEVENIYPTHDKKLLKWRPCKGIVIQGNEYDIKDFEDDDKPKDERVVNEYTYIYSTIYIFNFFGYSFAFPIGYKGVDINLDYVVQWQSGRNFSYTSDYSNSLAYKELQEYNAQAVSYANKVAGIQSYYAQQIANNQNSQLDISKLQSDLSYQSQINSLNTASDQTKLQAVKTGTSYLGSIVSSLANGGVIGAIGNALFGGVNTAVDLNVENSNYDLYQKQISILNQQKTNTSDAFELQKVANNLNAQFQCDTAAVSRDNAIANIAISNKYNNAKPNAYNQTDFTQYSSYFYIFDIDTDNDLNIKQIDNIINHYNVLGIYVGYLEKWNTAYKSGAYFDYIKGTIIDNSNKLFEELEGETYIQLIARIEEGIRLWKYESLDWFGNLTIDNTYSNNPEPYNELDEIRKEELRNIVYSYVYDYTRDEVFQILTRLPLTLSEYNYSVWFLDELPYGSEIISDDRKTKIERWCIYTMASYSKEQSIVITKEQNYLTINEKKYAIEFINNA